jgi:hypothetical protein
MDRFPVGATVTLEIPFVDFNGEAVTPTAVTYTVIDENDAILAGPTVIAPPYVDAATVVINGALNTPAGARMIELQITTAQGPLTADATYEIRSNRRLTVLTNSFQTYLQAQLIANQMPALIGWAAATEDQRTFALEEAYARLTSFAYLIRYPEYVDAQNIISVGYPYHITPQMWPVMTLSHFGFYPLNFRTAIAKAQVVEANAVLTSDPIRDKIHSGLASEAVGESKMVFRQGVRKIDMGISRDAMRLIQNYLDFRLTLTRS